MINIDTLIESANELDALPETASRLAMLVADTNTQIKEIVETVSLDPALTARVLRAANSAVSSPLSEIATVAAAVVRVGTGAVLSTAVGTRVKSMMGGEISAYGMTEGEFWRHSVAASLAAEKLVRLAPGRVPAEVATAALLHDIGKLVLGRYLDEEEQRLLHLASADGHFSPLVAESEILEVNHAELGGLIAQHWNLPESIVYGITFHENPEAFSEMWEGDDAICFGVALSDLIAKRVEADPDGPPIVEHRDVNVLCERLGLEESQLVSLCDEVKVHLEEVLQRYV